MQILQMIGESNVSDLQYSAIENRINFALDSEETPITININRKTDNIQPFGYLNFLGLTSSEFLGGINARVLKFKFKSYFKSNV